MINLKNLIDEVSIEYGIPSFDVRTLLCKCISIAYGSFGDSAYILDNGRVALAYETNTDVLEIKEYTVSKRKFSDILSLLKKEFQNYLIQRDINNFLHKNNMLIKAKLLKIANKNEFNLEIIDQHKMGFLKDIQLSISINALLPGEKKKLLKGEGAFFKVIRWNYDKKRIECSRITKEVAIATFKEELFILNKQSKSNYSIKSIDAIFINNYKCIKYFIEFRNKPSGFILSRLNKVLNAKLMQSRFEFKN